MCKFDTRNSAGSFPTAGDYGKCQKSTFYTLKGSYKKNKYILTSEKPK